MSHLSIAYQTTFTISAKIIAHHVYISYNMYTYHTVFTVISILGAAIAVIMKEKAKQVYITCGVLFSAGVLLAAGFVHLLNDSNEDFV